MPLPLGKPQETTDFISNIRYFVLHYPDARIREVYANNADRACEMAGWWFDDCFSHYISEEVTYDRLP
jgi:hypothetical protein